ncbi:MNIO family bufferin maturase [Dongia rigui]|uniref:UPF0276 protein SMD31_11470 n=1 Tax=Dongia rigui TaxID=940149 RepID=A0ABU5DZ43_9PROT|nr:DUF692 domain-containing protein [Dongia rigui]MDY0872550.1 DUF692 domain-containing protein [Dongia rigui]
MRDAVTGFGLGLRPTHYAALSEHAATMARRVDWLEIISENYMGVGGKPRRHLLELRRHYPMVMHGVSLSIGSTAPLERDYLRALKSLADEIEPAWISDHLCWTGIAGRNMHDLLPLPFTEEALDHVVGRVMAVQEHLGAPILLENTSSYVTYPESAMPEWEFIVALAKRTGCALLLDVNNVYVNSVNHGFNPLTFIDALPKTLVRQIHLAGHEDHGTHIIDTHDHDVAPPVWQLYAAAVRRFGSVPAMIERDDHIPPLSALLAELDQARAVAADAVRQVLVA